MGRFKLLGGVKPSGFIRISGAKNSALPILCASILSDGETAVKKVPYLRDVETMIEILEDVGVKVKAEGSTLKLKVDDLKSEVPYEPVSRMRASFNILGPLAMRVGRAVVALPGGCSIGVRPVDFHLKALEELGFEVKQKHGFVEAVRNRKPDFVSIKLDFPSVGATEHIMMTAVLMNGSTVVIENPAKEPEIVDLQNFLNSMGAEIEGAGTDIITVKGVEKLRGTEYTIIPDRIEAGTYMIMLIATGGEGKIEGVNSNHLKKPMEILERMGAKFEIYGDYIWVFENDPHELVGVDIETNPYPGFPTDLQPQMMVLLSIARGTSRIKENVFKSRFMHVDELNRMSAWIKVEGDTAIIRGGRKLSGATVRATDLRAASALLIAGICAEGETIIEDVEHIFRGYEKPIEKLKNLGIDVEYIQD